MDAMAPKTDKAFHNEMTIHRVGRTYPNNLRDFPARAPHLLPTPRAKGQEDYHARASRKGHMVAMSYLESNVQYWAMTALMPTPTANDAKNSTLPPSQIDRCDSIAKRILLTDPQAGRNFRINPLFVCEMMGFPYLWTESPFLAGPTPPSKPTAMP